MSMSHVALTHEQIVPMSLTDRIDRIRLDANHKIIGQRRSELGQFLTPAPVARLMAAMLICDVPNVSILDAGAGVGSLLSAAVEVLCAHPRPPDSIHVTAYEVDRTLIPELQNTLTLCSSWCADVGVSFSSTIIEADFISHVVDELIQPLFHRELPAYTCAILNPPYRKIQSASLHRRLLQRVGIEVSNLYAGFVALAIKLLAVDGHLVAITPRSFCNGPYFQSFRNMVLDSMSIRQFHMFDSREQAFQDDAVLQENIIFSAIKSDIAPSTVTITSNTGPDDELISIREVPYGQVVYPNDPHRFIHLVSDHLGEQFAARIATLSTTLAALGLSVSTGRVVDFRAAPFLRAEPEAHTAPLIYPMHIVGNRIVWPRIPSKKPNALVQCKETDDLFVPNGYYVLVKRFSSKEERRRVSAVVYDPTFMATSVVGFENHLNYFHNDGHGIEAELAHGLAAFLNSTLVDTYFRQFNGHTQVNATDLRMIHYPTREELLRIGSRIADHEWSQQELDAIIAQELTNMNEPGMIDPVHIQARITEALDILQELGVPRAQQNERSALTLLALLNLTPEQPWAAASNPLRGITPLMEFFAKHYGKHYKPNTRETVRRQTVHQFLDAGLIVANPDHPTRPINSPKAVYQIEQLTLSLLQSYGSDAWKSNLAAHRDVIKSLKQRYAQDRDMQRLPVVLPSGSTIKLSPDGQNVLVKQIVEEFAARFTPGGEIIYVGDADEKFAFFAESQLRELGVTIDSHGKMPDVVICYTERQWLVLIEAVTSHGPIDPKRRGELAYLFRSTNVGLVYVTAFLTRQMMREYLPIISWSTEVWIADAPDHLIHFNGDRFLGPYATDGSHE